MKKIVFSSVAALVAVAAVPAFAADMPTKAPAAVVAPAPASQWDVLFGVAFTSDYVLRGVSQSNRRPAVQGYTELDFKAADWVTLYANMWGSSLYSGFADAEFDFSGGARFSFGNFGLDVGYVYYWYPDGVVTSGSGSFGEFYVKPSYKVADWLTIGAILDGGGNFNNGVGIPTGSKGAYYYSANATVTLPWKIHPDVTTSINGEVGRQVFDKNVTLFLPAFASYTYWDIGIAFNYKAVTLDLRYWDTNAHGQFVSAPIFGSKDLSNSTFVATLKFDTAFSNLK